MQNLNPSCENSKENDDAVGIVLDLRTLFQLALSVETSISRIVQSSEGISFLEWQTLYRIAKNPGCIGEDIAKTIRYDAGALARILHGLDMRGLIVKIRHENDRRRLLLWITDDGKSVLNRCEEIVLTMTQVEGLEWPRSEISAAIASLEALLQQREVCESAMMQTRCVCASDEEPTSLP